MTKKGQWDRGKMVDFGFIKWVFPELEMWQKGAVLGFIFGLFLLSNSTFGLMSGNWTILRIVESIQIFYVWKVIFQPLIWGAVGGVIGFVVAKFTEK